MRVWRAGFDLPALKVAALHDPQKSLAVTLQADAQDIQRWMTQLLGRYSSAYASIQFRALRQFFKWQAAEEDLPDPMAWLRAPNVTVTAVPETGQDACWLFLLKPERRRPGCLRSP